MNYKCTQVEIPFYDVFKKPRTNAGRGTLYTLKYGDDHRVLICFRTYRTSLVLRTRFHPFECYWREIFLLIDTQISEKLITHFWTGSTYIQNLSVFLLRTEIGNWNTRVRIWGWVIWCPCSGSTWVYKFVMKVLISKYLRTYCISLV